MKVKDYIKNEYSKFWYNAREKIYGFPDYDKCLCQIIKKNLNPEDKILDVCCGTGYPYLMFFKKYNLDITGIDISLKLLKKCYSNYGKSKLINGDVEKIPLKKQSFSCIYCFHSTWFFENMEKFINDMLEILKDGGILLFDILNKENKKIYMIDKEHHSRKKILNKIKVNFVNIIKFILRRKKYWNYIVYQWARYPSEIIDILTQKKVDFDYFIFDKKLIKNPDNIDKYEKVIFRVKK